MKKIITTLFVAAFFTGCAARPPEIKFSTETVNQVINGMTVAQATSIVGIPPTDVTPTRVKWRSGKAQTYIANPNGSIEFDVVNGVIVNVPPGGIFGPVARERVTAELNAKLGYRVLSANDAKRAEEQRLAETERQRLAETERNREKEQNAADAAAERLAEAQAVRKASVTCTDKTTCTKIFSLAQIYVMQHSDQKIQVATDTIIETYNPTEDGKVGMSITKAPRRGTTEVVTIAPACKSEHPGMDRVCTLKRTGIYLGFAPFIAENLAKP